MIDLLLYTNLTCSDASEIISRMTQAKDMNDLVTREVVVTIKEATPHCPWDAND